MNYFKFSEPWNFPTGPIMPFKTYLKKGYWVKHVSCPDNVVSIIYPFTYILTLL